MYKLLKVKSNFAILMHCDQCHGNYLSEWIFISEIIVYALLQCFIESVKTTHIYLTFELAI